MAQTISGDSILSDQSAGVTAVTVDRLTALQQAGMRIVLGVGSVALLVMFTIGLQWLGHSPTMPSLSTDAAATKASLDNYRMANEMALDGPSKMFDLVIVKLLYPLFTLVLGYIFGTRVADTNK